MNNMNHQIAASLDDLHKYVEGLGYILSPAAARTFEELEKIAFSNDNPPLPNAIVLSLVRTIPLFRNLLIKYSGGSNSAEELFELDIKASLDDLDTYARNKTPYSEVEKRKLGTRSSLIDLTLAIAQRHSRIHVFDTDILEACLQQHEEIFPIYENGNWTDERLHNNYLTLSHILGTYHPDLDIKFDHIRSELGLVPLGPANLSPVESAPYEIRPYLLQLLQDYPEYDKNCFLVMSFDSTPAHDKIVKTITEVMGERGFSVIRADQRSYADDLWSNVQTCIYGSKIAIAVFERVTSESFNPNVSYEVGYIHALKKHACLLKEKTLPTLHTDIAGKLYQEFDIMYPESLSSAINAWLKDKRLTNP